MNYPTNGLIQIVNYHLDHWIYFVSDIGYTLHILDRRIVQLPRINSTLSELEYCATTSNKHYTLWTGVLCNCYSSVCAHSSEIHLALDMELFAGQDRKEQQSAGCGGQAGHNSLSDYRIVVRSDC